MDTTHCPNCNSKLKDGIFGSNEIIDKTKTQFIHLFTDTTSEVFCKKCATPLFSKAKKSYIDRVHLLKRELRDYVDFVPLVSLHYPKNWEFTIIDMVSAQSVTGTGVISELTSSFSDLFGSQSGRFNSKLKAGENICKSQLRLEAIEKGANAIIGTDIDYAEVGSAKGMLMVCMAGTAIRLHNPDVLGEDLNEKFEVIEKVSKELFSYRKFQSYATNS